jgi:hypothetical protein
MNFSIVLRRAAKDCIEGAGVRVRGKLRETIEHSNGYPVSAWTVQGAKLSCSAPGKAQTDRP